MKLRLIRMAALVYEGDFMGINFDDIEAKLRRVNDEERRKEAHLEQLRQKRDALMEQIDGLNEDIERIENPDADKSSVLVCGAEVAGAWVYGNGRITRLTPPTAVIL